MEQPDSSLLGKLNELSLEEVNKQIEKLTTEQSLVLAQANYIMGAINILKQLKQLLEQK
jgi:hypothetical protein